MNLRKDHYHTLQNKQVERKACPHTTRFPPFLRPANQPLLSSSGDPCLLSSWEISGYTTRTLLHFYSLISLSSGRRDFWNHLIWTYHRVNNQLEFIFAGSSPHETTKPTLSATDVLAPTTMKNAAKCDTSCELQNPVSHQNFERTLHFLGSMSVGVSVHPHPITIRL